jgi:MFS superfamily sulfate permease-like transporter
LLGELGRLSFHFRLPDFTLSKLSQNELFSGIFVLGLPQVALTLGNAIIATVEENNAVFPARPITVKAVAIDHGIMNVVGSSLGGVPMCHGAGGMAAHIRFGARTGGALVILGSIMLVLGLFFADSIATFFKLFPPALLGVILMFGGLELAAGVQPNHAPKEDRYVMFLTAGVATWNMGVGYLVGLLLWYAFQWRWLKA